MGKAEAKIEDYLRRRVKETGGQYRKLVWPGHRGAPDEMVWWFGPRVAFVECKAPGGRLDPQQDREIAGLTKDGFKVFVVRSPEDVDRVIVAMCDG